MVRDDLFRRKREEKSKRAGRTTSRFQLTLDSNPSKRKFFCLVEDNQKLWAKMFPEIISDKDISIAPHTLKKKKLDNPNPLIMKGSDGEGGNNQGKFFIDDILKEWDKKSTNYAHGKSSCACIVDGKVVELAFKDRVFAIVDLDKPKIGSEGRFCGVGKRKIRTDPCDTESMFIQLDISKVLNDLGLKETDWVVINECAKKLTSVLPLLRDNELSYGFLSARTYKCAKKLFKFFSMNSTFTEIMIDSEGLFDKVLNANKNRKGTRNFHDKKSVFIKRLELIPGDDVFGYNGHILAAILYFVKYQTGSYIPGKGKRWGDFHEHLTNIFMTMSPQFAKSEMAKDMKKWFLDRDISNQES